MNLAIAPTRERIFTLDVIRGFALLGILSVNIFAFSTNGYYTQYIPLLHHKSGLDYDLVIFFSIFLEGKMRGLFTLLFGAGIILGTHEKEKNGLESADYYYRRMLWLLAFGLIDAYLLLWRGDILYEYALIGMLLFAFRKLRARYLLLIAIAALGFFTWNKAKRFILYKETYLEYKATEALLKEKKQLTEKQKASRAKWSELTAEFPPWNTENLKMIKEDMKKGEMMYRQSYPEMFTSFKENTVEGQSSGFYGDFLESFGTILLGMGLYKTGFLSGRFRKRIYAGIALAAIVAGSYLGWNLKMTEPQVLSDYMHRYETRLFSGIYDGEVARLLMVLSYASLLILFCKFRFLQIVKKAFAGAGKMPLTNYVMQTLICSTLFYSIGFGLYGKLQIYQVFLVAGSIFIVQICYSALWLRYFSMGPLEWLWRSLIYKKFLSNRLSKNKTTLSL